MYPGGAVAVAVALAAGTMDVEKVVRVVKIVTGARVIEMVE